MLGFSSIGQSLLKWFLSRYLGKYVENIESRVKDFQYGLSGGTLLLDNLNLKAEALVGLDLPIEVKAGHIGLLEVKLPAITSIRTDSFVVKIDNVLLLASPICDRKYDEVKDVALQHAHKREVLAKLEQLLEREHPVEEDDPTSDPGFLERMKVTILQNIQVKITNIHIRYEDDVTNPSCPFTFGITLLELSLLPSDATDEPISVQFVNKLLKLKELSVYWNRLLPTDPLLKNHLSDYKSAMSSSIEEGRLYQVDFDYLIEPINGSANLIVSLQEKSNQPVISCSGSFEHISINFKRHMFLNAIILNDSFKRMRVNEKYRKYHPGVPCHGNSALWWRYAYNCVMQEVVIPKKQFWTRIWEYRSRYKTYRNLYVEKLLSPDNADVDLLDEQEMELNIESIVMARKEAEKLYLVKKPNMAVVKPADEGFLSRLSNWWYGEPDTDVVVHAKHSAQNDDWWRGLSEEDKQELYKAFDYSKDQALAVASNSEYVKYKLDVKLEGVQLNLFMNSTAGPLHVASLYLKDIIGSLAVRVQGLRFCSSIEYMEIYHNPLVTDRKFIAKVDAEAADAALAESSSLLSVVVEQYPSDVDADVSIQVYTLPVRLMYDHDVMCAALAFFNVPRQRFDIGSKLRHFTPEFSTAGLQYAIDKHQRVHVKAMLSSPYIVIPSDGVSTSNVDELIIDCGVLRVDTELRPKSARLEDNSMSARENALYDKYILNLSGVKILYVSSDVKEKDKMAKKRLEDSDLHLMPSLSLISTVSVSAEPTFTKLPRFKIDSCLDYLQLKVSTSVLESLLSTVYTFPRPSPHHFTAKHKLSTLGGAGDISSAGLDCVDNPAVPAGVDNLMRSELRRDNSILDEMDFEKIQRLEDKDIFVTQGDLLNLWFLLSKESREQKRQGKSSPPDGHGLNAVADLLMQPDDDTDEPVRVQAYDALDMAGDGDEEFVLASDKPLSTNLLLPGLNSYTGTEFYTLLFTTFTIKGVSVKLLNGQSEYLSVAVEDVSAKACRTNCCVSLQVKMKRFKITDDLHLDENRRTLHIAQSSEAMSMASFEGCFVDDVSQLNFTKVANAVVVDITSIHLILHDESVKRIMTEAAKISKLLTVLQKSNEPRTSPPRAVESESNSFVSLRTAYTDKDIFYDAVSKLDAASLLSRRSLQSIGPRHRALRRRKTQLDPPEDMVICDIKCCLKNLSLDLQKRFKLIATLEISDVSAEYEMKKAHWSIDAKLGALSLCNPKATIYKNVLVVEDGRQSVLTFHLTSYNQSVQRNESCDQQVELKMRRMRLIFINKFVSRLTKFFGQFSSPTVNKVQERSRQRISATAQSVHSKGTTTLISIEMKTPLITVPENGKSHNALLLILGDLSVRNEFISEPVHGKSAPTSQSYDLMTIRLENIGIERITYVNERKYLSVRRLLTPVSTEVKLKRALPPVAKSCVDLDIQANINQFKVEVSQQDMQMLGKVLYENVLMEETTASQSYAPSNLNVTDVGSTISSALSSTGSASGAEAKALTINLTMGGLLLHLKKEKESTSVLQNVSTDLAVMDIAELKVDFCKGKKDSGMTCLVTLRNFTIDDMTTPTSQQDEGAITSVIELDDTAHQVLLVKYFMDSSGNSELFCSVQQMRFNVNMPFVKAILTFIQQSFITWKQAEPPRRMTQRPRGYRVPRRRRLNPEGVRRRVSRMSKPLNDSPAENKDTKMVIELRFGKQSLYLITGDGSQKALVAELNIVAKAEIASAGKIEAGVDLTDMAVFTTSLRSEESHLRHECLANCDIRIDYSSMSPRPEFKDIGPPKVDIKVSLSSIDIRLSTNVIYHAFDTIALLRGEDNTDDTAVAVVQSNEDDLDKLIDLDRNQWLEQYDVDDHGQHVEINPAKAAVETLTITDFALKVEFAVAIGAEFVPILRTRSNLSAELMDWTTKLRAQCRFSLDCSYYNELLDVWEPLLEPILDEERGNYRRWEILTRLTTAASHPIAKTNPEEILVDSQELDTFIHHQMSSARERKMSQAESTGDAVDFASVDSNEYGPSSAGLSAADRVMSAGVQHPDVIMEEEEEDQGDGDQRPMLASAGLPSVYVTQPSVESKKAHLDVLDAGADVSICQSIDDRTDEADVIVDEKDSTEEIMCTYVSLVSRDKLLLNVTPQGLSVVTSVIDTFTNKPNDSTLFEVYKAQPLTITNLLGIPAKVSLHKKATKLGVQLEHVTVDNDMRVTEADLSMLSPQRWTDFENPIEQPIKTLAALTVPVKLPAASSEAKSDMTLRRHDLILAVDGYKPIGKITYRRTQAMDFSAKPVNPRIDPLCLRVRTHSKHGRRHVYVYSQLKIRNELQCPVQVSYQELRTDEEHRHHVPSNKSIGIIQPDEMLNIPALVAQQKKLQVRPIADENATGTPSEFCESSALLWWKDHLKAKAPRRLTTLRRATPCSSQVLTCSNQLQQTFTFKVEWMPRSCQAKDCGGSCPSFDAILMPAVEVKNFLPFAVDLDIHSNSVVGQSTSYSLQPGDNKHVTDQMTSPAKCTLTIPDYQGRAWKGHVEIHDKMAITAKSAMTLSAVQDGSATLDVTQGNRSLTVFTHVARSPGYKGCQGQLQVTFFASHWISNTTGLTLQFKSSGFGSESVETDEPYPVLFTPNSMNRKMMLRIPGCRWSKTFSIDAVGTVGSASSVSEDSRLKYRFMVETTLGNTQLNKIITIFPMFVVLNKMEQRLWFREAPGNSDPVANEEAGVMKRGEATANGDEIELISAVKTESSVWTCVAPHEAVAFWPTSRRKRLSMMVKKEGAEETTLPFPANVPQRTLLSIGDEDHMTADVSGGLGTEFFITLRQYQLGDCVVRIENLSEHTLQFTQGSGSGSKTMLLGSCKSYLYYWPNPQLERKLFWSVPELNTKPQMAVIVKDDSGEVKYQESSIFWQSYGDNLQRVLAFSQCDRFQQIIKKKNLKEQASMFIFTALESACFSMINKDSLEIAVLTINQSPSKWQVKPEGQSKWYPLGTKLSAEMEKAYCDPERQLLHLHDEKTELKVDLSSLKFIQPMKGDIKRDSFPGLKVQYQQSDVSMVIQSSINHLQIDNQLPDAFYPTVFHPLSSTSITQLKAKTKPCLQLFVRRQFPLDGCADAYKTVCMNIEPSALRIDKGFMLSLLDFIGDCRVTALPDQDKLLKQYHLEDIDYCLRDLAQDTIEKTNKSGSKIYVEMLKFSTIKIKLSFSMAGTAHLTGTENTQSTFGGDVVDFLFRSVGMTLTEVTDIDFTLREFVLMCGVLTTDQLTSDLRTFYTTQAISQAYVFVLGLDVIGNPLGLIKDVRQGISDVFATANPISADNNQRSLAHGVRSAYGNIVGGVCAAASKITESFGRGFTVLSFDKTFQRSRSRRVRSQPSQLHQTIILSLKTLGYSVASGVGGLVIQPKRCLDKQGAPGFFKGVGKGLTGVVTKPVGGVFDSVSVLLDGCRRAAQSDIQTVERVRLPRHIIPSEGVKKYHPYLAEGYKILYSISTYRYSQDNVYFSHLCLKEDRKQPRVALATTRDLYMVYIPWYGANYRIQWSIPVVDLDKPTYQPDGVIRIHSLGDEEDKELRSSDLESLKWFNKRLNALRQYVKSIYRTS